MNKGQFIAYLAPQFGDSKKEAARAVEVVFDAIGRFASKEVILVRRNLSPEKVESSMRLQRHGMAVPPFSQCSKMSPAWLHYWLTG